MSGLDSSASFDDVLKFHNISSRTRTHLSEVYALLSALVGSCAVGSYLGILGYGNRLCLPLGFFFLLYVLMSSEKHSPLRFGCLIGFGMLEGMSIGPLLRLAIEIDPSIILTALSGSLGIFICFSAAALFSDRRSTMYLGAVLSSVVTILLILSLLRIFGIGGAFLFNVELYIGLFVFMGYVVYDTQIIISRCESGAINDSYSDAANLFVDLFAIFVRLLVIAMKKSKKEED